MFDATDVGRFGGQSGGSDGTSRRSIGLSHAWRAGAMGYQAVGAIDAWHPARTWSEALVWTASEARRRGAPIVSLQAWGHGGFGFMAIGQTRLDRATLAPASDLAPSLDGLRAVLDPRALVWLRCCSAFGDHGRDFARALADRLGVRVAGHTHVIGFFQSGTHALAPGEAPAWDPREGVRFEDQGAVGARGSSPMAPNTITCLETSYPDRFDSRVGR